MIGMYGPIFFEAATSPEGIKKTVGARWGTHELWRAKPLLEYAGPSLIGLEFKMIFIKPFTADPLAMVILLEETMDLALPYPLILGIKPMGRGASLFVMEDLTVSPQYFFQGGAFLGVEVEVKLKEYPDNLISTLLAALGGVFGGGGATGTVTVGQLTQDVSAGAMPATLAQPETAAVSSAQQIVSVAQASRT
jgi:hypothetical protein